jgi:parallel beta-helix repeat protein
MSYRPGPGDWKGIHITFWSTDSDTILKYCTIEYGGHTNSANLWIESSSPSIKNCTFHFSSAAGIRITGTANPTIHWSTIRENAQGILLDTTSSPIITFNTIENNTDLGANNLNDNEQLTAIHNWWGAASGPNPYGTGNGVSGSILVTPWTLDPSDFDGDGVYDLYEIAFEIAYYYVESAHKRKDNYAEF